MIGLPKQEVRVAVLFDLDGTLIKRYGGKRGLRADPPG